MNFKPELVEMILAGDKTQTRRLVKDGETFLPSQGAFSSPNDRPALVESANGYLKWRVGNTYAVCPGQGKEQVARFLLTGIRREQLQDISPEDAHAELGDLGHWVAELHPADCPEEIIIEYACCVFREVWKTIFTKPGTRWEDNPAVWVLNFELAG